MASGEKINKPATDSCSRAEAYKLAFLSFGDFHRASVGSVKVIYREKSRRFAPVFIGE